jgi:hypothetical protein
LNRISCVLHWVNPVVICLETCNFDASQIAKVPNGSQKVTLDP